MTVKLDMGFFADLFEAISSDKTMETDYDSKMANFANDVDLASSQFVTDAEWQSYYELKNIFDYVHISPIKVSICTCFLKN